MHNITKKIKIILISVILLIVSALTLYGAGTLTFLRPVVVQDISGFPMVGVKAPLYVDARLLAAGVAESHTVPTGAKYVLFSTTANFYVNFSTTATVPSGDVTDGSGSELNPVLRDVTGIKTISLISPTTCTVTLGFFK